MKTVKISPTLVRHLLPGLLAALFLLAPAGLACMDLKWKKKGDKMALEYTPVKGKKRLVTDYIFDASYTGSYYRFPKNKPETLFDAFLPGQDYYSQKVIRVRTDEGFGVINGMGEVVVPFGTYDDIDDHWLVMDGKRDGKQAVYKAYRKGAGWGLVRFYVSDTHGKKEIRYQELLAPCYDWIGKLQYLAVKDVEQLGYGADGNSRHYDRIYDLFDYKRTAYCKVAKNKKYGVISIHYDDPDDAPSVFERVAPLYDEDSFCGSVYADGSYKAEDSYWFLGCVKTNSLLFVLLKEGHRVLVKDMSETPVYVSPVPDKKDRDMPAMFCSKVSGFYFDNYCMSLPGVGSRYGRVRVLPDEHWDIYQMRDTLFLTAGCPDEIRLHCTGMKAFPDKSGWFSCVDRAGDTIVGYHMPIRDRKPVLLKNTAMLQDSGKVVERVGPWEVFRMDGQLGLRHDHSDFILPPVYDMIVPAAGGDYMLVSTLPAPGEQRLWGIVSAEGVISPAQFDEVDEDNEGRLVLTRSRWTDLYGVYALKERRGSYSKPFRLVFNPATGEAVYNFDELLGQYADRSDCFGLYADLESLGAVLDLDLFRALNDEAYGYKLAQSEEGIAQAEYYLKSACKRSDHQRFRASLDAVIAQKKAYADARAEQERIRAEEAAAAAAAQRQSRAEAWAQLASALGQMAQGVNNAVGQYAATKSRSSYRSPAVQSHSGGGTSSASGSQTGYTTVEVLEVWVPGAGSKAEPTYEKRTWYKRFYGNRWCLFPRKDSPHFHTATTNNDRTCQHADVSGYRYKAIDPKVIGGTKYYYFN